MFACRKDCAGHQTNYCAEILRCVFGLHFSALFFRIIIVAIYGA